MVFIGNILLWEPGEYSLLTNFDDSCDNDPESDGVRDLDSLPLNMENMKSIMSLIFLTKHSWDFN